MRKSILFLGMLLCSALAHAKYVPTADMAMSFRLADDPRKWTMVSQNGDQRAIIAEFTIDREDINHWSEMVAQQIDFVTLPLDKHLENWISMLTGADPKIVITQKKLEDGSILATYDSVAFDEVSVRRFVQGPDGVYMLAYHVRHRLMKSDVWDLWTKIVTEASLVPNPMKKSGR